MAGTNSAFDGDLFREQIRSAMRMGLPGTVSDRATFQWRVSKTYPKQDVTARPYDWTDTPVTEVERDDVQVPVAVEFSRTGDTMDNPVGSFETPRAVITVLDEDYAEIEGASHVLLGGNRYFIRFVAPPMGLFDVTVYQIYCQAMDEA